jgi:hypothetical protein
MTGVRMFPNEAASVGGLFHVKMRLMAKKRKRGWYFQEDRHLLRLAAESRSLEAIAAIMKRKPALVLKRAARLGISIRTPASYSPPKRITGRALSKNGAR